MTISQDVVELLRQIFGTRVSSKLNETSSRAKVPRKTTTENIESVTNNQFCQTKMKHEIFSCISVIKCFCSKKTDFNFISVQMCDYKAPVRRKCSVRGFFKN
ncbi:hypothetical protein WA026_005541 [Henosepilachna vigintioctopunctata]|uniref:Uncharacterized protein n=1 Tax=Henosepilachna vigintioctopunctata TaxID=420089 RepID=A0AAW1U497_9CUCU